MQQRNWRDNRRAYIYQLTHSTDAINVATVNIFDMSLSTARHECQHFDGKDLLQFYPASIVVQRQALCRSNRRVVNASITLLPVIIIAAVLSQDIDRVSYQG
jgi:hypothetical protein